MTDHLPTATLDTLQRRARLLRETRRYFDAAGYFEVDTPLLSADVVVDTWIEPFIAPWRPAPFSRDPGEPRYLQTSPEFAMKRLLAAGASRIYQLAKVFRNGEFGRRHNPEFTMLEWYRVGDDLDAQLAFTEDYVRAMARYVAEVDDAWEPAARAQAARWSMAGPFERLTYDEAFQRALGCSVHRAPVAELRTLAMQRGLAPPASLGQDDKDGWLNWLLAEVVEPALGRARPTFLLDYPATQAALAKTVTRPDGTTVARRFELYIDGVEYCNGYDELIAPAELRRRNHEQNGARVAAGLAPLPVESRLLAAMEAGLPESAGVALGFDRLVMLLTGTTELRDVLPFAFDRA